MELFHKNEELQFPEGLRDQEGNRSRRLRVRLLGQINLFGDCAGCQKNKKNRAG